MSAVTTSTLPPQIRQQAVDQLLVRPMPYCIHSEFADYVQLKPNMGDIARFSRYQNLNTFPTPLGPSFSNPPLQSLTRVDIDKESVDVKFLLMDLKTLPRNGEDNKAQAEQFALAA
jgi:hypothetical protein